MSRSNWKAELQLRDLDGHQKLELTCKECGHVRTVVVSDAMESMPGCQLYLDEIESRAKCKKRGCKGHVRLALLKSRDTSAFVGGLA
ncbi:hypothetical protein GCM10010136_02080 [Limoniibacter endophyticus]|uniref:Uncharacterized protein n=1 Tax=Limoniibacter endophyticus TaxID=1565040 RepID=A0A8J3DNT8_9HYPH|nr:hypothetical protein GCM10010136_02080 [Limoniibacter endophyticus]